MQLCQRLGEEAWSITGVQYVVGDCTKALVLVQCVLLGRKEGKSARKPILSY